MLKKTTSFNPTWREYLDLHVRCKEKFQTYSPKWWWFNGDESHDRILKESPTKQIQAY